KAVEFKKRMKDVTEFLAAIELNPNMAPLKYTVTYQDSCHLAHGQKIKVQPRKLLRAVTGLNFREMPMSLLEKKMESINVVNPDVIVTANPGCMLQLQAGAKIHGKGQRVAHVV